MTELLPTRHRPFSSNNLPQASRPDHGKSGERAQRKALEVIETCYNVVPAVLHQLQQLYPGTKFICGKSKSALQEELNSEGSVSVCSWHLIQEMIVLRVVLKVDSDDIAMPCSLKCYFGLWEETCDIDADKLTTTLTKLIASHGGWTPADHQVPVHPYVG
ncbi:MAG TPA: hypothetical protein VF177_14715 [Anaerolineae bacterium]